jgi:excinuclease UvrABC nuclease subunit
VKAFALPENLFDLEHVSFKSRDGLPDHPGVYFLMNQSEVLYIGSCNNLWARWRRHHVIAKLTELGLDADALIAWIRPPGGMMHDYETAAVQKWLPRFNVVFRGMPHSYFYKRKERTKE